MKKLINYIAIVLVFTCTIMNAQDIHVTQFYANPLYLNPAFTGANACSRVSLTYRNQWPGINKAYSTYMLSADHFLSRSNLGIGVVLASDVAGSGNLKTTIINPQLAYEAKLGRDFGMRFGMQPGINMRSVDYNKLIFGDQIANGGAGASATEIPKATSTYFDLGSGILFYSSKYWGGIAVSHINQPTESLVDGGEAVRPLKYSIHGGSKYTINPDEKDDLYKKSITAAFNYRGQKKFDQLDIGFYYMQSIMTIGVWYRGLPIKQYQPGYPNNDAIAIIVGAKTNRMNIGYSYDITISKLAGVSRGAHELNLSYQFCVPKKKKKRVEVICPKF